MLCRLALMVQAAVLDSQFLNLLSPFDNGCVLAEVGIGWGDVADTLVVAVIIVMIDKVSDLVFEITR